MILHRRPPKTPGPGSELAQVFGAPLIRTVGLDFGDTFLHGTARKNIRTLAAALRPLASVKQRTGSALDLLLPPEQNEFRSELLLAEPRQPQQAHLFAQGDKNALAVVMLRHGARILDLSDEAARAPRMVLDDGPRVIRFFSRPAIADALIAWRLDRVVAGYRERNPDWRQRIAAETDPADPGFMVESWQEHLLPFARAQGLGAVRFADEILVADRSILSSARLATEVEVHSAATVRTWAGAEEGGLFTDQPTGAHAEAARLRQVLGQGLEDDAPSEPGLP